MLIQNLPPHIRALAEQRRREQPEYKNDVFPTETLRGAFLWDITPEGILWWNEMTRGHVDTPYPPHALKTGQEVLIINWEMSATSRVFIGYWNNYYWCYRKVGNTHIVDGDTNVFPVIKSTLTIQEIAEWKGVTEDEAREMVKQII